VLSYEEVRYGHAWMPPAHRHRKRTYRFRTFTYTHPSVIFFLPPLYPIGPLNPLYYYHNSHVCTLFLCSVRCSHQLLTAAWCAIPTTTDWTGEGQYMLSTILVSSEEGLDSLGDSKVNQVHRRDVNLTRNYLKSVQTGNPRFL